MAKFGVGLPTYNRGELLRESLLALRAQTVEDVDVLVLDNASTDDTPRVFEEVVGDDPRFRYERQPETVAPLQNFHDAIERVRTDYFMWRADDDLSAANYLESLGAALDADPRADLAVCPLRRRIVTTGEEAEIGLPPFPDCEPVDKAIFLLGIKRPTWIYGLWRREALAANLALVADRYPYAWASDHLQMMPSVLEGRVTASHDTWFGQRIYGTATYGLGTADRLKARAAYAALCEEMVDRLEVPPERMAALREALERHYDWRVGPRRQLRRRLVRDRVRSLLTLGLR